MLFLLVIVLAALALPALSRGSYARLAETRWRALPLFVLGIGAQVALEWAGPTDGRAHGAGYATLVASYGLLLAWTGANLLKRGMAVVALGIALNGLVIALNRGMPVDVPAAWAPRVEVTATVKHHPYGETDRLRLLADIVPVPGLGTIVSFGDLIMAAGLLDVVFHASRRSRSRPAPLNPARPEPAQVIDLTGAEATETTGATGTTGTRAAGAPEPLIDLTGADEARPAAPDAGSGCGTRRGRRHQARQGPGQPIEHV